MLNLMLKVSKVSAAAAGTIQLGDLTVNRLGLGTNRITDTDEAHHLLQEAVNLDINFIDTAYRYQGGASETAIGNALAPYKGDIIVATKGGWEDTRPEELRAYLEGSLDRLQTKHIDLYQLHRVNPDVPIEESVAELKRFQDEGLVRNIGLSEVSLELLQRAQAVAPIVSVQNEYNVAVRSKYEDVVDYCTEQGIAFIPWFPLGGLSGGTVAVERLVVDLADKYEATPQQIALAWLLRRSPIMLPIPGTLSLDHLRSNLAAAQLDIRDEDYGQLSNV
jgi:pyridoxine 4-dehydrogenase